MIRFAFQEDSLGELKENILGPCEAEGRETRGEAYAEKQAGGLKNRCRQWQQNGGEGKDLKQRDKTHGDRANVVNKRKRGLSVASWFLLGGQGSKVAKQATNHLFRFPTRHAFY